MRGKYLHNRVLVEAAEALFWRLGAETRREYWIAGHGFIDLVVFLCAVRIAVEAEVTVRRLRQDVSKAAAFHAAALLIIAPTGKIARDIQRELRTQEPLPLRVVVMAIGAAREALTNLSQFLTLLNVPTSSQQSGHTSEVLCKFNGTASLH